MLRSIKEILAEFLGESQVFEGSYSTVYGVLQAERSDGSEGLVLMAPFRVQSGEPNICGIAFLLAFVSQFRKYSWWSRDLVILIPGIEEIGSSRLAVERWLTEYHGFIPGKQNFSGVMQAGLSIELEGGLEKNCKAPFGDARLYLEGPDGLLPNLDLVNTILTIYHHRVSKLKITESKKNWFTPRPESHLDKVLHACSMLLRQAIDPGYAHGPLLRYRIDAVTLAMKSLEGHDDKTDESNCCIFEIVELTLRSLSNILEHLHQSFFFYIMTSTEEFVSISKYIVIGILPIVAIMIRLVCFFFRGQLGGPLGKAVVFFAAVVTSVGISAAMIPRHIFGAIIGQLFCCFMLHMIFRISYQVAQSLACFIGALSLCILLIFNFGLAVILGLFAGPLLCFALPKKFRYFYAILAGVLSSVPGLTSAWLTEKSLLWWNAGVPFVVLPSIFLLLAFADSEPMKCTIRR